MWDDEGKVGILNDFDLARFADQTGASGQDNTGTLPFMALDLLSEEGLRGEIPRRYRHEAESFTWSLICLCLATVEGNNGENRTRDPHPLHRWFQDWAISRDAKIGLKRPEHDNPDIPLVYQNVKPLAFVLHKYWVDRYFSQFPGSHQEELGDGHRMGEAYGWEALNPLDAPPPYQEPEDDTVFGRLLFFHDIGLAKLQQETEGDLLEMSKRLREINWAA